MKIFALVALVFILSPVLHVPPPSKPHFAVTASATQTCTGQSRSYVVNVTVVNNGSVPTPARFDVPMVMVQDAGHPSMWSGSAGLPAIAANGSTVVRVTLKSSQPGSALQPKPPLTVLVNSGRWIIESDYSNGTATVTNVQAVGCAPITPLALGIHLQPQNGPTPHLPGPSIYHLGPNPFTPPTAPPQTHPQPVPANFIAPPTGLTYTTDPTVCVNHVGLLGAFVCEAAISQAGLLLLIWSWAPCNTSTCQTNIQGYHIYQATAPIGAQAMIRRAPYPGSGTSQSVSPNSNLHLQPLKMKPTTRTPIDTQSDPTITMRGITPYHQNECFVVTAYGYGRESDDSNTFCVGASAFVTTPYGIHYVAAYDNTMILEWFWTPCPASSGCVQSINGFNVYQTGGAFVTQQTDPARPVADVGPFVTGTCYVVRAFRGNVQSDPSSPFCVTAQMVPTPSPRPGTPSHVDIDVTDDSFPASTFVKVGGSITWKNDDTDEHDVYANDGSFYGDLPPGETFTQTFPRTGTIGYYCHFHQPNMKGTITVVSQ